MRLPVSIAGTQWATLQDVQRARKTITRQMVAKIMMAQPGLIKTFLEHVDAVCSFYSLPGSGTSHVPGFFAAAFTQLISQAPSSWVEGKLAHVLVPRLTQGKKHFVSFVYYMLAYTTCIRLRISRILHARSRDVVRLFNHVVNLTNQLPAIPLNRAH
jgi:hypothetical protein